MLPFGIHHSKQSICLVILFSRSQTRTSPTMEYISKLSLLENHLCEANPFLSAVQTNALTLSCTETDVFWLSSASAPLPACKTQVHKQILILGTWKRCAPISPMYPRQLGILMAKTGKSGSFCFCMCLEWLLSQIPLSFHLLSQAQPGSPVAVLSTTRSPPSGARWPSCGQETPPCSPGKAGPQHPKACGQITKPGNLRKLNLSLTRWHMLKSCAQITLPGGRKCASCSYGNSSQTSKSVKSTS